MSVADYIHPGWSDAWRRLVRLVTDTDEEQLERELDAAARRREWIVPDDVHGDDEPARFTRSVLRNQLGERHVARRPDFNHVAIISGVTPDGRIQTIEANTRTADRFDGRRAVRQAIQTADEQRAEAIAEGFDDWTHARGMLTISDQQARLRMPGGAYARIVRYDVEQGLYILDTGQRVTEQFVREQQGR